MRNWDLEKRVVAAEELDWDLHLAGVQAFAVYEALLWASP